MKDLARGIYGQLVVMDALALRETRTRFGNYRLGFLWALAEPVLGVLTFYAMFAFAGRPAPSGMDMLLFLTTGFVTYYLFTNATGQAASAISANLAILFYPQVKPPDIIIARGVLEFGTYAIAFFLLWFIHGLAFGMQPIYDPLTVLEGLVLAALLGTSLGSVFCALGVISNTTDRIRGPLMRPLFWLSGTFFALNELPLTAREVLVWNPVLHCVEMVRGGLFESYDARYTRPGFVLECSLGLAFVGLTLERRVRHKIGN